MRGRRLPDAVMGEGGPGWDAWKQRQPGDYMRVTFTGGLVGWYICDPLGNVGTIGLRRINLEPLGDTDTLIPVVQQPPVHDWKITEHDDGTITVAPSIMDPDGWHGYLECGDWRAA